MNELEKFNKTMVAFTEQLKTHRAVLTAVLQELDPGQRERIAARLRSKERSEYAAEQIDMILMGDRKDE